MVVVGGVKREGDGGDRGGMVVTIMAVRDGDYGCDDCDGCGDGDGVLFWNSETSRGRSGRALSHNFGSTTVTHLILLAQAAGRLFKDVPLLRASFFCSSSYTPG